MAKEAKGKIKEEQIIRIKEVELGGEAEPEDKEAERLEKTKPAAEAQEERKEQENEKVEKSEKAGESKRGGFWHRVNASYPWLKFAAVALLAIGVTLGGFGVANLVQDAQEKASVIEDGGTGEGINTDESEHKATEDPATEGKPAEEQPTETEEPAAKPEEQPAENTGGDNNVTVIPPTKPVVVPEGTTGKKLIALTFDDGPSPANTGRLLDILKEKNVKATFFVLGNLAERNPALVQREEAEGHEVGSHTPYHNQQTKLSPAGIQSEAATMNQIFINVLGHSPVFTRPPYGSVNDSVRANLNQPLILWSIDPEDWKYRNAATVRANVVRNAHDGAIALMHDIHATTVDAVPGIIDDLRAQGYEFLTVSELAKARGVTLQNGWSYYNFRP